MTTKQVYAEIDARHTNTLKKHGLAFRVDKIRNAEIWTVQIGKFNSITDAWIQAEISNYSAKPIEKQFESVLKSAIKDKTVNYDENKKQSLNQ
jgi:hypothetical protein